MLLRSLGRFAERLQVQEAHANGELEVLSTRRIGPPLVGVCGKVLQGAGVAIPPPVRKVQEGDPHDAKTPS